MIPVRVELTNFLSHRRPDGTPAVFDFEGAKLWSVSGDNGAGKSAIFDGITWALYATHRGGRQDAQRLISHGADGCVAAFVFDVEGRRYRVERSLRRRGSPKRRAEVWDVNAGAWTEIPDTSSEAGFTRWRDELVALSYEAFTHSVLLLQAGSDALIRSGAKDRFEVLAQLVDLSRYQRLERLAQKHNSELSGRRKRLDEELEGFEPVRKDERRAADAEAARLEEQQQRFARVVEERIEAVAAARRHTELVQRTEQARERIAATEGLVVDAQAIRAEAAEHERLTAAGAKLRDAHRVAGRRAGGGDVRRRDAGGARGARPRAVEGRGRRGAGRCLGRAPGRRGVDGGGGDARRRACPRSLRSWSAAPSWPRRRRTWRLRGQSPTWTRRSSASAARVSELEAAATQATRRA